MSSISPYRTIYCGLFAAVAGVLGIVAWPRTHAVAVTSADAPAGFAIRTVVSGLTLPTDMVFLPSGDILVTEKGVGVDSDGRSRVRLIRDGQVRTTPVLELSTSVPLDSGLLAIVLDPDFTTNHHFYLWYASGEQAKDWAGTPYNRLSRFEFDPESGTAALDSEEIILDGVPWAFFHAGGGLLFDTKGNLFITVGDASVFESPEGDDSPIYHEPPPGNPAQDLASLAGKVLRIRPQAKGYTIPDGNPFVGQAGVVPEIYAYGLRNPFRITRRLADGQIYLIDVGFVSWEEVNRLQPGANYGWPIREGPCPYGRREENCKRAPSYFTDPVAAYVHQPGVGASITAFAFYEGQQFPAQYQGRLFYADLNLRSISTMDLDGEEVLIEPFAEGVGAVVDMEATPEGIYLLNIGNGSLELLYYIESDNQPPVAQLSAMPLDGKPPLPVIFSAEGSYDLDDIALQYEWDFGDGQQATTASQTVTHTYQNDGVYAAQLTVIDVRGARSNPAEVEVTVFQDEWPAIDLIVLGDNQRDRYRGGDEIMYRATRLAGLEGLDGEQPYTWDIDLLHNQHAHPLLVGYQGEIGNLTIPVKNHDYEPTIRYRFRLTMRTEAGQEIRIERELQPELVEVQFDSTPRAAPIQVSHVAQSVDTPLQAIVGQLYVVEAAPEIVGDGMVSVFDHWSIAPVGSATPHTEPELVHERRFTMRMPQEPVTVVAHYVASRPAQLQFLAPVAGDGG